MRVRGMVVLAALAACAGIARSAEAPAKARKEGYAIVFDFFCPGNEEYGRKLANAIRMRLARHEELEVIDRLTTGELSEPLPAGTDTAKVVKMMTDRLAVNIAVYGTVSKSGRDVRLELRGIDLRKGGKPKLWKRTLADGTQRPEAVISKAAVEAVTGRPEWVPPQYGDEEEPKKFGKPLNVNGGFDAPGHAGWQQPDNVASFLEPGPAGRGKILRIRTNIQRWPYINYIRAIRMGKASPKNPPKIATQGGYSCLGGFEGVHFKSEWIEAAPGQRYWVTADFNKAGGTPKVFLKGFRKTEFALDGLPEGVLARMGVTPGQFADMPEARRKKLIAEARKRQPRLFLRECYRWYLNCRGKDGQWDHLAAPVPPRGGLPANVEWLQLQVYCYWPPGTYLWDNVHLYKDPRQKAPLPEEGARTPNFGKTSDVVEKETAEREKRKQPPGGAK